MCVNGKRYCASVTQTGPTRIVAQRVKDLIPKRGLTSETLAARMDELGIKWNRAIVANLVSGRRSSVSVDELLALALVLNVAPVHLLVPPDDTTEAYQVTAKVTESSFRVRGWIRGLFTLASLPRVGDQRQFFSEVPPDEFKAVQQGQCPCCGGRHIEWVEADDGQMRRTVIEPGAGGGGAD